MGKKTRAAAAPITPDDVTGAPVPPPADPASTGQPAAAAEPEAEPAAAAEPVSFLDDFVADVPHEAHGGEYSFNGRDRWHGQPTGLDDGWHVAGEDWFLRVEDGLPAEALRRDHPRFAAMPEFDLA